MSLTDTMTDGSCIIEQPQTLEQFFISVEKRALRIAELSVGNREDALDVLQDSMMGMAKNYSNKPAGEWPPLFYRILNSRITDFHRRMKIRNRWRQFIKPGKGDEDVFDPMDHAPDLVTPEPDKDISLNEAGDAIIGAIERLPLRQKQAFMLRHWEGLSVADTATTMQCSVGSVKTHLSRALKSLRTQLEDYR